MLTAMRKRPMSRAKVSSLGGKARAKSLSAKQRRKIAQNAAKARWRSFEPSAVEEPAYQYVPPVIKAAP